MFTEIVVQQKELQQDLSFETVRVQTPDYNPFVCWNASYNDSVVLPLCLSRLDN